MRITEVFRCWWNLWDWIFFSIRHYTDVLLSKIAISRKWRIIMCMQELNLEFCTDILITNDQLIDLRITSNFHSKQTILQVSKPLILTLHWQNYPHSNFSKNPTNYKLMWSMFLWLSVYIYLTCSEKFSGFLNTANCRNGSFVGSN